MCGFRAAEVVDPNQLLGSSLGGEALDPGVTPRQAAQVLLDRMAEQVEKMVRDSLVRKVWLNSQLLHPQLRLLLRLRK